MSKNRIVTITFGILLLCITSFGQTTTNVRYPVDDTYIYSDNTIRGMESLFKTYHSTAGNQFRRISFLKFDISGMSPYVQSVKLRLYTNGFQTGGDNAHQFDLYPVALNSWSEDDISFLNYTSKVGADISSPFLASVIVPQGESLSPQYIEFSGNNLLKYLSDSISANKQFISFRLREKNVVKNNSAAVIVEFHSKENTSGFAPELILEEKNVESLKASSISVDNKVVTDFSESNYRYIVKLPWNTTTIPTVTAVAKHPEALVTINQAVALSGVEANRTARIIIANGSEQLTYSVIFELLPPPTDTRLSSITIDGRPLEFFDMDSTFYKVFLPYSQNNLPIIEAVTFDPNASVTIKNASEIAPLETETDRTAILTSVSANGEKYQNYRILFEKLPKLDIILAIGQSNMAGRAQFSDYSGQMNKIFILTPKGEMEISSNPMNKYSNIRKDISIQGLGPSYSCALDLQNFLKKPVGFVVNAQGGSSITTWYQPGKSNYDATLKRAKEAQRFGQIKAIIWHQGSSDNTAGLTDNFVSYKTNLSSMVQNFRKDLNEPDMLFVCGELAERPEFDQFSSIVVLPVADYIPNSDYVTTEGTNLLSDGIHFDTPSNILMGQRYAAKIIHHLYENTNIPENEWISAPKLSTYKNSIKIEANEFDVKYHLSDIFGRAIDSGSLKPYQIKNTKTGNGIYLFSYHINNISRTLKLIIQ